MMYGDKPWLKSYEPQVPPTLDYPESPLYTNLEETARKYPDATATIFLNHEMTYRELNELTDRFAAALQQLGVKKGDRVAVYMANCPQFIMSYYGALKAGAMAVTFNPLYAAREVEHQLGRVLSDGPGTAERLPDVASGHEEPGAPLVEVAALAELGRAELREAGFPDAGEHAPSCAIADEHRQGLLERGNRGGPEARAQGHRLHLISD